MKTPAHSVFWNALCASFLWEGMAVKLGFSYVGALMLALLFIPNIIWTRHRPRGYEQYVGRENKLLQALERAGEVLTTGFSLIFSDFNVRPPDLWSLWLLGAGVLMVLYELFWVHYFCSGQTMEDFYGSLLGIPVAGAVLPVLAFLLLAVYGKNPLLLASALLLGVGHIGIHLGHRREVKMEK